MTKRRAQESERNEVQVSVLDPLVNSELIRIGNKHVSGIGKNITTAVKGRKDFKNYDQYSNYVKSHDNYKEFQKYQDILNTQASGPEKLQLANFVINSLAKKGELPGSEGASLDSIDLIKTPYRSSGGSRMDFYSGDLGRENNEQRIILSPYKTEVNPITSLMHEGTHALDDFVMRTYQKEAIDSLAEAEKAGKIGHNKIGLENLKTLVTGAKNIIGHPDFNEAYYPFEENFYRGGTGIQAGFKRLSELEDKNPTVQSFQDAQRALNDIKNRSEDPDADIFQQFSEFPTFAMERLFNPWDINEQTNPQSREFLKNVMTGVRRNFKVMGGGKEQFKADYPKVYDALKEKNKLLKNSASGGQNISSSTSTSPRTSSTTSTTQTVSNNTARQNQSSSPLVSKMTMPNSDNIYGQNSTSIRARRRPQSQDSQTQSNNNNTTSTSTTPSTQTIGIRTPLTSQMMPTPSQPDSNLWSTPMNPETNRMLITAYNKPNSESYTQTQTPLTSQMLPTPTQAQTEPRQLSPGGTREWVPPTYSTAGNSTSGYWKQLKRGGRVRNPNFFSRFKMANYKLR